jgi:predicted RNase H-like HicB family nuclease
MPRRKTQAKKEEPQRLEYSYTVLYEPAEEGGYVVTVPALPGLVTEGDTLEEAREMAKDAIKGYIESLVQDGQPIPGDIKLRLEPKKEQIKITVPA